MTSALLVASALLCQAPKVSPAPAPKATASRVATREAVAAWLSASLAARRSTDRLPSNFNSSRKRDHYVRRMGPKAAEIAKGAGLTVAELEAAVREAVARGEPGTAAELAEALQEFRRQYNQQWLIERYGYRTPSQVRSDLFRAGISLDAGPPRRRVG